jgi:hypothetical protein
MATTRKKRPRDQVQLGKLIVEIATRQTEEREDDGKDAVAAELGRNGGTAPNRFGIVSLELGMMAP